MRVFVVSATGVLLSLGTVSCRQGEAAPAVDTAMFAGGCFWSMERPFQHMPGVRSTTS